MEPATRERTNSSSKARKLSKVFDNPTHEDAVLEGLGYQQGMLVNLNWKIVSIDTSLELRRSFGLIGMIGFSFSIVTWYVNATSIFGKLHKLTYL
jgi:hypothetical protein